MASFPKMMDKIPVPLAIVQTGQSLKSYAEGRGRDEQAFQAHKDMREGFTQVNHLLTQNNKTLTESKKALEKGFNMVNKTCPKGLKAITPNVVSAGNSSILDREDVQETWIDSKKAKE